MKIRTGKEVVNWTRGKSIAALSIDFYKRKWVALDDIMDFIEKHKHCSTYHKIKKEDGVYKGTCLYKLFEELSQK